MERLCSSATSRRIQQHRCVSISSSDSLIVKMQNGETKKIFFSSIRPPQREKKPAEEVKLQTGRTLIIKKRRLSVHFMIFLICLKQENFFAKNLLENKSKLLLTMCNLLETPYPKKLAVLLM